jgi:hypothetical protein
MTRFYADTLARLLLSFMPLFDYIERHQIKPVRIASFGSGSCAHETFLAELFPGVQVDCFDASEKYIPVYVKEKMAASDRMTFHVTDFDSFDWHELAERFDFVFSIQTLEHISDSFAALGNMATTVALGGLLYVDTPFYSELDGNEDPNYLKTERERQWEKHKHFHFGFSREGMSQRLKSLGFELIDSGYLAYSAGDAKFLHFFRNSGLFQKEHADADVALSLAMTLLTLLRRSEEIHAPRFSEIDQCRHKERPANAIRILARKSTSIPVSAGSTFETLSRATRTRPEGSE